MTFIVGKNNNNGADPTPANDKHLRFTQFNAESVWTIEHNLDKYPSIQAYNTADERIIGEEKHITQNKLTITFSEPVAGYANLN